MRVIYTCTAALLLLLIAYEPTYASTWHSLLTDTIKLSSKVYVGDHLQAGDTVVLEAGERDQLLIKNLCGSATAPITIINGSGLVTIESDSGMYGIAIRKSKYFHLTGTGAPGVDKGIFIKHVSHDNAIGLTLEKLSSDFEIDHLEISDIPFAAIIAKTDPDSSLSSSRDSFLLSNAIFHDNYIHDIHAGEGFYIGHSKYKTGAIVHRNGKDTVVMPHLLTNVQVYNNVIENTGFDGIQVSSVVSDCNIYNNQVSFDSQVERYGQMSGIIMGGGSDCDCYNNKISDGKGAGILMFGLGNNMIYNNLVKNAGISYLPNDSTATQHGIYISDKSMVDSASVYVFNNTIVSPKSDGIRFNSSRSFGNKIYNNLVVDPGTYYTYMWDNTSFTPEDAYVYIADFSLGNVDTARNFGYQFIEYAPFKWEDGDEDFELMDSCFLIDAGMDVSQFGISTDLMNHTRPLGLGYDIGAYESDFTNHEAFPTKTSVLNVFPNPAYAQTKIKYQLQKDGWVSLHLMDVHGRKLETLEFNNQLRGTYTKYVDITEYAGKIVFVYFEFDGAISSAKILCLRK